MIGTQNEGSLHASLKEYYAEPDDIIEGRIDGYLIDVVKEDRLVEIQTKNFTAMRKKLKNLLKEHQVHLVYPIATERYLVQIAPETGEILNTRKSPKRGKIYDLFSELIRIPHLILHPNLTLEVVLIKEEEIRCPDGKGSWRRRGVSILDRRLIEIIEQRTFSQANDYLNILPADLVYPFTNQELAKAAKIPVTLARKVTYTLKKAELLDEVGKNGNEIIHDLKRNS